MTRPSGLLESTPTEDLYVFPKTKEGSSPGFTFNRKIISGYVDTVNNFKLIQKRENLEKRAKILDEKIKISEKIGEDDLKELREIVRQLKGQNIN